MTVFLIEHNLDSVLSAVFDAFSLHLQPQALLGADDQLPLFTDQIHKVTTTPEKAQRVWTGLEKKLSPLGLRMITLSYQSEIHELDYHLFCFICKVFNYKGKLSLDHNFSDTDLLYIRNCCHKVTHEALRMKQFIRFQKAQDGTYLAVVFPDHNVIPLVIDHFQDRFNDQPWLIFDSKRRYGYYYNGSESQVVTFPDDQELPFSLSDGKMREDIMDENEKIFQNLWKTYFKAICIKERMNPRKQLNDMPRRYWKYMTEKN